MEINILVTLDKNYIKQLNVMLASLLFSNLNVRFKVYWLHNSINECCVVDTRKILGCRGELVLISVYEAELEKAPISARYPHEMYYRIFAAKYLPKDIEKILYLDPDIIINGSIEELYNISLENYFYAAASHTGKFLTNLNSYRLDMEDDSPYINSGVMLMNLKKLREEQDFEKVFEYIEKKNKMLILPDQDIISSLYGSKIYVLDSFRYNMTERLFQLYGMEKGITLNWIKENSVVIHYCGKNKPWKENYRGQLGDFYENALKRVQEMIGQ